MYCLHLTYVRTHYWSVQSHMQKEGVSEKLCLCSLKKRWMEIDHLTQPTQNLRMKIVVASEISTGGGKGEST